MFAPSHPHHCNFATKLPLRPSFIAPVSTVEINECIADCNQKQELTRTLIRAHCELKIREIQ
jgi:hypothetical protein